MLLAGCGHRIVQIVGAVKGLRLQGVVRCFSGRILRRAGVTMAVRYWRHRQRFTVTSITVITVIENARQA
jgi:hypothetical protein